MGVCAGSLEPPWKAGCRGSAPTACRCWAWCAGASPRTPAGHSALLLETVLRGPRRWRPWPCWALPAPQGLLLVDSSSAARESGSPRASEWDPWMGLGPTDTLSSSHPFCRVTVTLCACVQLGGESTASCVVFFCCCLDGFIEMKFPCHRVHPFKVYAVVFLSMFTELCYHHLLNSRTFHEPERKLQSPQQPCLMPSPSRWPPPVCLPLLRGCPSWTVRGRGVVCREAFGVFTRRDGFQGPFVL